MIIGIGTDIIEIKRIARLVDEFGEKFLNRIFNDEERTTKTGKAAIAHYAKRYAAKEAISKAMGTGIGETGFRDIKILNKPSGQPYAEVKNKTAKIHLSLSDDSTYALAYAVIEA